MVESRPALLVVATRDVDARVEGLKNLLDGTEHDLGNVFVKLPHLLLADFDGSLPRKVLPVFVRAVMCVINSVLPAAEAY